MGAKELSRSLRFVARDYPESEMIRDISLFEKSADELDRLYNRNKEFEHICSHYDENALERAYKIIIDQENTIKQLKTEISLFRETKETFEKLEKYTTFLAMHGVL